MGQERSVRALQGLRKGYQREKGQARGNGGGGEDFEQGEAQTVESYFRPDWN